jgi:hypothetical protein
MNWQDLSKETRGIMKELGSYTLESGGVCIRGYIGKNQRGERYLDATDLRNMAKAFMEVAYLLEVEVEKSEMLIREVEVLLVEALNEERV